MYARGEDELTVECVTVGNLTGQTETSAEPEENCPSARRQGLRVRFSCECCGGHSVFWSMWQHKGQTFCGWDEIK